MPTVSNGTRGDGRSGSGRNQLSVNLEAIKDVAVREALEAILGFCREMVSGGLSLDGDLLARALQTDGGGTFRVKVFEGTIRERDTVDEEDTTDLKVPGKILGAFGYSQVSGSEKWQIMSYSASGSHSGAYWLLLGSNTDRSIQIRSNDTVNRNSYRAIIFYSGDRA